MIRKESGMPPVAPPGGQHVMVGPPAIVGSGWSGGVSKGGGPINPNSPSIAQNGRGAGAPLQLQVVIALYTYQGSEMGDMSFQKGDRMEVLDKTWKPGAASTFRSAMVWPLLCIRVFKTRSGALAKM